MTCIGKTANGVIVLPPNVHLPDGMELEVRIPDAACANPTLAESLQEFIGIFEGPHDLAANHDHYIHGTPKR